MTENTKIEILKILKKARDLVLLDNDTYNVKLDRILIDLILDLEEKSQ